MPLGCELSPDGKLLAITTGGYNDSHFYLIDTKNRTDQTGFSAEERLGTGRGVAAVTVRKVYASGCSIPNIFVYARTASGRYEPDKPLAIPDISKQAGCQAWAGFPFSGVAVNRDGKKKKLFVGNFATDSIYVLDTADGSILAKKPRWRKKRSSLLRALI